MKMLFVFLFILFFLSCSNSTGPSIIDMYADDYFPLEEGCVWVRRNTNVITGSYSIDTVKTGGEVLLYGGISGYEFCGDCATYINGELRFYYYPPDTIEYSTWISEPIEVGNEWVIGRDQYGYDDDYYYIEEIGISCTIFAGTYENCIKVSEKDLESGEINSLIFAPDVGLIKGEIKYSDGSYHRIMEIVEFYKE